MRTLVRRFWGTIILLVLVVAVCVQLGREAFPMLNDHRGAIAEQLSEALGVQVEIGGIDAQWVGLRPRMQFSDVVVKAEDGQQILAVGSIDGNLSLVNSLREWQMVWRRLEFAQLHMQFEQDSSGHWTLGGLSLARPRVDDSRTIADPLDIFLLARHITLTDSTFEFNFRTGHHAEVTTPRLILQNEDDFHRLAANVAVDGDQQAFALVVEGRGNPRLEHNFTIDGYLSLENFPMERVVAALDIDAWDAATEGQWSEGHRLDTNLWFSGNPYRQMTLKGRLRSDGLPIKTAEAFQLPVELRTSVTGSWEAGNGWQLGLQQAEVSWEEFVAPPFDLLLSGAFGEPLRASLNHVDLASWHSLADQTGVLQGKLAEVLASLAPEGSLTNVHIEQRSAEEGHFQLRANMHDLKFDAWAGAPAIEQLDGYVEATGLQGRLVIDSDDGFSMLYPRVYREPLQYQRAGGEVSWYVRQELGRVEVVSGLLSLSGEEGEGRGYLHLSLPYRTEADSQRPSPEMTLLVGLRGSQAQFHRKYVPYKVPEALYKWLQGSVRAGDISEAGFLWHGPMVRDRADRNPALQLFGRISGAQVQFSPEWPAAEQIEGHLLLDDRVLDVVIDSAEVAGNQLQQARVQLIPQEGEAPQLQISGNAAGSLGNAFQLLRESPLSGLLGPSFSDWQGEGEVNAQLNMKVPLEQPAAGDYRVELAFKDAALQIPEANLALEQINGPLRYNSAEGVQSEGLNLSFGGQPATASVTTTLTGEMPTDLLIDFTSSTSSTWLAEWLNQPQLNVVAEGHAEFSGRVAIPLNQEQSLLPGLQVSLHSELKGMAVNLPGLYGKSADEPRNVELELSLAGSQQGSLAYGDVIRAQWLHDDYLRSANLVFGNKFQPMSNGYFDISGRAGKVSLPAWRQLLESVTQAAGGEAGLTTAAATGAGDWHLTPRFDVHLETLELEQFALEQLYLSGEHIFQRWRVDIRSPYVSGELFVFDDGKPMKVHMSSLRLPAQNPATEGQHASDDQQDVYEIIEEQPSDPVSLLKGLDLKRLPAMDFSAKSITSAGRDYGSWSFQLRPVDGGIALRNLQGDVMGLQLGGQSADERGGELVWLQSRESNSTYVRGRISTQDVEKVLREAGQAELLESARASFDLELHWPGAPDELRLESLEGRVSLDVRDGRFIRGAEAGNNPFLRLFGLLNFDTLARRLQLDFSDLYKEGMVFDSVAGQLHFAKGRVLVTEPLRVESPSSTLQFAGVLDARRERIDANLVATLPMSGNLAIAAAFVGGLPAAVGVYAVSKLFKEQVDRVSSIRYEITGPWDDPNFRVDRIFESSTEADRARLLSPEVVAPQPRGGDRPSDLDTIYRQPLTNEPPLEGRQNPQQ